MAIIAGITATQILDSRGIPTIECQLWLDTGAVVVSSAPSGTSKGQYEAVEIRDNDPNVMNGQGVTRAISNINTIIAPQLIGKDPINLYEIDNILKELDGTPNKSNLGCNAIIAVSQVVTKAGAVTQNIPLYYHIYQLMAQEQYLKIPSCIYSVINGGIHGMVGNLDFQDFQLIPASYVTFPDSLNMAVTIYHKLGEVLRTKGAISSVGLVGGYTPNMYNNSDAFEIMIETIKATPYIFAQDLFFGADFSAETFYKNNTYVLKDHKDPYSSKQLFEYYQRLRSIYHVFLMEDPYSDDDWKSWQSITKEMGATTLIVGDSFLATNYSRSKKAIDDQAANAMVIKPNEVGTISDAMEVVKLAKRANWNVIVSHRSGETNDTFIADFAVGTGADYVKFGPPHRGERIAKLNRLMEIYHQLNEWYGQQQKTD